MGPLRRPDRLEGEVAAVFAGPVDARQNLPEEAEGSVARERAEILLAEYESLMKPGSWSA